jgi:hypothetical protein
MRKNKERRKIMKKNRITAPNWIINLAALLSCVCLLAAADTPPARIGRFPQEIGHLHTTDNGLASDDVRRVALDAAGNIYAATAKGLTVLKAGSYAQDSVINEDTAFSAARFFGDLGLFTCGRSLLISRKAAPPARLTLPAADVCDIVRLEDAILLGTDKGIYRISGVDTDAAECVPVSARTGEIRQLATLDGEQCVAAAENGLFHYDGAETWEKMVVEDGMGRIWGASDVRGVAYDAEGRLWFATLAGTACSTEEGWAFYTGAEGLPWNDFTCMAAGADGAVWFGTTRGAIRFHDGQWDYRQGRCWLPDDEIRDIAVAEDGSAWFATAKGLGRIERRMMTLAEKAAFYEDEMEKYIKRTPFGYVSEVGLKDPEDKSAGVIYSDSDNDGLWTSMYGAGECFGWAATKNPRLKQNARQAFEALRFLQKVTQGGEHAPPKGYVARTIISADDPDPNIGRVESDREKRATDDALWKVYEPRWPKSADGKWYWKSDTSSDELDGHYFFYPAYYDLVADTPEEKERVREVVRDLTDHIIEHGFYMVDHDGTPTRWSVYAPESLNQDVNWWSERGLKSLSMLSYLAVAQHVTGDRKYDQVSRDLISLHNYRANAMISKIHFGIGSGNQSDDEMAFMCFYNLMKYSQNEALRDEMRYSFYSHWTLEEPEMNPFFNFCYAAFGRDATYTNPWGTHPIPPWDGWLGDAMRTLKGFPLDRRNWARRNSHRIDLRMLPRQQAVEPYEPFQEGRGCRNNGKVLPVENRHFNHWNTDPWRLDYGGNGTTLASGTVFLLPYYMGLYHGFIEETEK